MKLYYKDNGITTASSRKREEEKYKLLCIICQKNKSTEKLSSTDNGKAKLITALKIPNDGLFGKFNDNNISSIKYHRCSWYKTYILGSERQRKNELAEISSAENI